MKILKRLRKTKTWVILSITLKKYSKIDGTQWAGAFAFDTFFSLFPLVILAVTIASIFIDRERAGAIIISQIEKFIPINEKMKTSIFSTITNVINIRSQAGLIALFFLLWSAIQGVLTLIRAVNRAWNADECSWWRMPMKSLLLLIITAGTVLLSKGSAIVLRIGRNSLSKLIHIPLWIYTLASHLIPFLLLFLGISLFFLLATCRPTKYSDVWPSALGTTILLQLAENLFLLYLNNFTNYNALYGAFGGIMALLMWIYLSGIIFILGACLCPALHEVGLAPIPKDDNEEKKENKPKKRNKK